ncbi:adenylyl cyclase-associated protein [Entamoeba histolytica HM-3:IMSS]|uniref:Adenylyl cyclase-associated protein n=3 Tax=Entamoeba histolytica TaxID=5759 RepID=C4M295_ENTH1|nr:adenylyl cyclase-associated protein, putative [Entamoeba histolytica HM-1:IMSS]EAL49854.2 adenylyl cyclase-associated protein, putative [Entamoeba histolytica HM-1:IMSS]EMS11653.1 adenylyl cyclase-associated protein [Entamoeba histolytica HM-3:IMSS]GAT95391.1 adenylyl cyclase-associated protein putative [Entamoeba histolytica]|eukprot:XP_655240.2 adenylyl cyclase-associated protein, putative [Entamoeba histolytica HM-1:IMSS]
MSTEAELKTLLAQVMNRLETVTARLEKLEGNTTNSTKSSTSNSTCECGDVPKAVQAFKELIEEYLKPQVEAAQGFDEILGKCMNDFLNVAEQVSGLIEVAAKSQKPTQEEFQKMIQPISEKMMAVGEYKDKNFKSPYINYLSAIGEAVPVFGWICVEKTPAPYVADLIPGSEFYTNKVLVATKGKEQNKYDWALNFIKFLKEMVVYIKQYHTTGLTWNPKGGVASAQAAPVAPKVETPKEEPKPVVKQQQPNPAGLFAELNKGTAISGGLKHVTADMKTKNMKPEDKVPLEPKKVTTNTPKPATAKSVVQKPPKIEKNLNKWDISYHNGNKNIEIDGTFQDSIYIFKCENSAVKVNGKINCISVDGCKKLTLICDTIVSYVEVINCNSIDIRVIELTPTVNIDKSQSVNVHLSEKALDGNTTVNTSKCDAVNISFPNPEDKEDEVEYPIPEQIYTIVKENKLYPQIYFHDKSSYYFPK